MVALPLAWEKEEERRGEERRKTGQVEGRERGGVVWGWQEGVMEELLFIVLGRRRADDGPRE